MKKITNAIIVLGIIAPCLHMYGQVIPNRDLESWTTVSGLEIPYQWETSDLAPRYQDKGYHTVYKSTDSHSGEYALELKSLNSSPDFAGANAGVHFTIDYRPTNFNGYYKSSMDQNDSFFIYVYLYKKNGTKNPDLVGYIFNTHLDPASSYTSFSLPINYVRNETPDSGVVFFATMQNSSNTTHEVLLDDLSFSAPSGIEENSALSQVKLYPNPTLKSAAFTLENKSTEQVDIRLLDLTGRPLETLYSGRQSGTIQLEIDLGRYPAGMYFLETMTKDQKRVYRLIKE